MDSFKPLIKGISSTPRSLQWNHFSYKTSDEFGTNQRTQSVSFWPRLRSMTKPQLLAVRCGEWGIFAGNKKNSPSLICMSLWTPFSRILTQASPTKFKNQSYKMNSLFNTDLKYLWFGKRAPLPLRYGNLLCYLVPQQTWSQVAHCAWAYYKQVEGKKFHFLWSTLMYLLHSISLTLWNLKYFWLRACSFKLSNEINK